MIVGLARRRWWLAVVAALNTVTVAQAESAASPAPSAGGTVAIVHAKAYTIASPTPVDDATIVMRGGEIAAIGAGLEAQVAILSETLARQLFQQEDPVGRRIVMATRNRSVWQVVGVVADVKLGELERAVRPALYTSNLQESSTNSNLVIRSAVGQASLVSAVRRVVQTLDPELPVYGVKTMEQLIQNGRGVSTRRSTAVLLSSFAAVALLLAAIGLYGVMSYGVAQRTREIGMLRAVGMTRRQLRRVIRYESTITAIIGGLLGIAVGLVFGWIVAQGLSDQGLVFVVPYSQLVGFLVVATLFGILAAILPARRAAKLNVLEALQYE
jgi:putative ABC transport system permease protein